MTEEEFELVEINDGVEALFVDYRYPRQELPEGLYCYDLRGKDDDPGDPCRIEKLVMVNHAGSIITAEPLDIPEEGFIELEEGLGFLDESMTIGQFMKRKEK
jgi:hypothetical protein